MSDQRRSHATKRDRGAREMRFLGSAVFHCCGSCGPTRITPASVIGSAVSETANAMSRNGVGIECAVQKTATSAVEEDRLFRTLQDDVPLQNAFLLW